MRKRIYNVIGGQALLFIVIGLVILIALFYLDGIYGLEPRDIVVEAHGMLFDILLFGIILAVYDRITRHKEDVQRYLEEIDDFRGWEGKEAMYRIVGNIRRLNRLGVTNVSLVDGNLSGANLLDVNLEGANLLRTNFQGSRMTRANLKMVQAEKANLEGIYASESNFSGANLQEANLQGAELIAADLSGANLLKANLLASRLMDADLRGAEITGVDFRGADLKGAQVDKAQVRIIKESGGDVSLVKVHTA